MNPETGRDGSVKLPLYSILFCEFDDSSGPKILTYSCVDDNNQSLEDEFVRFTRIFIPKPELCGKSIVSSSRQQYLRKNTKKNLNSNDEDSQEFELVKGEHERIYLSYAVRIESSKYRRNALLFNIVWILQLEEEVPWDFSMASRCIPLVSNVAGSLRHIELEKSWISSGDTLVRQKRIKSLISSLLLQLRYTGFCNLSFCDYMEGLGDENVLGGLYLICRPHSFPSLPQVHLYEVPVPRIDIDQFLIGIDREGDGVESSTMDPIFGLIIPHITGHFPIIAIARLADVSINICVRAIQHLLLLGVVSMGFVFNAGGRYEVGPSLSRLLFMSNFSRSISNSPTKTTNCSLAQLVGLYASLGNSLISIGEFSAHVSLATNYGIDPCAFVSLGCVEGFVRRLSEFPILPSTLVSHRSSSSLSSSYCNSSVSSARDTESVIEARIESLADGSHPLEELSCASGKGRNAVLRFLDRNRGVLLLR